MEEQREPTMQLLVPSDCGKLTTSKSTGRGGETNRIADNPDEEDLGCRDLETS